MINKWIITEEKPQPAKFKKNESLMCQGNGYMGVRNSYEEEYIESHRNTFINGVFNAPSGEVSELVSLPDVTNLEVYINGERFFMSDNNITQYSRKLFMNTGETLRSLIWTSKDGIKVKMQFRRIVSYARKHIVAEKVTITPDEDVTVKIVSGIDGKITNTGVQHFAAAELRSYSGHIIGLYSETTQSKISAAVHTKHKCSRDCEYTVKTDRRGVFAHISTAAEAQCNLEIEKISSYAATRDFEYIDKEEMDVRQDGMRYLTEADKLGYDGLFEESARIWDSFWEKNEIVIKSDNPFYGYAINFALYHLRIMANDKDNRLGIGAKGLTGEGYMGHSFWDTEIFVFPYYVYNAPDIARRLLEYRYRLLDKCREKAEKNHLKGAMYPWESAWIDDGEACPELGDIDLETGERRPNLMGKKEIHINSDIAYAVWLYYSVTGDKDFMDKYGFEIIMLTAEFWMSRAEFKNGRYEILDVIGPDEYKENVDNNAYTNYMAHFNLKIAKKILEKFTEEEKSAFLKKVQTKDFEKRLNDILTGLYLPESDKNGVIEQFDGFFDLTPIDVSDYKNKDEVGTIFKKYPFDEIKKMRVCKQADTVMLFYTLPELFDKDTVYKNFEYYESCTTHDSSLSLCIHSLVASCIGKTELAKKLFEKSCEVDLGDNTNNSDNGIHAASIGGIWLAVVKGMCGLNIDGDRVVISPNLPEGIEEISFRVMFRGSSVKVAAGKNGSSADVISGNPIDIVINEQ